MKFIFTVFITFLFLCFSQGSANSGFLIQTGEKLPQGDVTLEQCMSEATEHINGHVAIVEFKSEDGIPIYEFEILSKDGRVWNVEVNAQTGLVVEFEKHVAPDDKEFASQAKISKEKFDVHTIYGGEIKIEIEAETGKIHAMNP